MKMWSSVMIMGAMSRDLGVQLRFLICPALLFILTCPNEASAFNCRINDQAVFSVDQGASSRYTGFKDGFNIGETMRFNLSITNVMLPEPTPYFVISLIEPQTDFSFFHWSRTFTKIDVLGEEIVASGLNWSPNSFRAGGNTGFLKISRYHMSDWHGSLSVSIGESAYTVTLNCIGVSEELDSVRRRLLSVPAIEVRELPRLQDMIDQQ